MSRPDDPRDEAERARAALKRNAEMDMAAIPAATDETPSVTPSTFGEEAGFKDDPARPPTTPENDGTSG